uniref:Uncharacterized protein n=1 Tax=Glypta fumiferanae TaxID=389681 RepID=A0A0F6Q8F0_9HYME|nr:hypothetical protein [Glypta fumiferanae]
MHTRKKGTRAMFYVIQSCEFGTISLNRVLRAIFHCLKFITMTVSLKKCSRSMSIHNKICNSLTRNTLQRQNKRFFLMIFFIYEIGLGMDVNFGRDVYFHFYLFFRKIFAFGRGVFRAEQFGPVKWHK